MYATARKLTHFVQSVGRRHILVLAGVEPHLQRKLNQSVTTNKAIAAALVANAKAGSKQTFGIMPHSGPRRVVVDGTVTHVDSERELIPF